MRSVQPGKTYRTFGYAGVHEIHQAEDLMEKAHREVTGRSRTYIETVAEVAPDYRIRNAGVNLDNYPDCRSYQAFYELGMASPTHAQMADSIIETFGNTG